MPDTWLVAPWGCPLPLAAWDGDRMGTWRQDSDVMVGA